VRIVLLIITEYAERSVKVMASEYVKEITEANFEDEVINSSEPVVVDLWAEWCMPCRMIAPIIEELAQEYNGRVKFGKLNVDENRNIAVRYSIQAIPTLLIFKDGQLVQKLVGLRSKADLEREIDSLLE